MTEAQKAELTAALRAEGIKEGSGSDPAVPHYSFSPGGLHCHITWLEADRKHMGCVSVTLTDDEAATPVIAEAIATFRKHAPDRLAAFA